MSLHMLKLQPDMPRVVRWATAQSLLPAQNEADMGYTLHALLVAAFGALAPKPFALQQPGQLGQRPGGLASVLAYSAHAPDALRDYAAVFADPDVVDALGLPCMAAKAMPDAFPAGRRLGFTLRARPTVRTDRDGDRTRVREVDAFLAAGVGTPPGAGPNRSTAYRDWLTRHLAAGGAVPDALALDAFRSTDVQRRDRNRVLRAQRGPDALFSGVLRVTEPDAFAALLARGVGRHRAFGYGMLLLRPASGASVGAAW